jgi:2-oxo-3-hexenedioate decarboxylase/2-keto-4-pentenoate hydratase
MLSKAMVDKAATLLARGRLDSAVLGALPDDCRPRDEAEAYAIQDRLHSVLEAGGHGRVAGHKIGCTTPVMQAFLGIANPCAGAVFDTCAHALDGTFDRAGFRHVGVECEIAVSLAADLPAGRTYDREAVAGAVRTVMAAIEVVDDRYVDYQILDTPTLIADDFFSAGCVLGPPVADWRDLDLAGATGRMTINGAEVGRGKGGDILGHPVAALAWLANARAGHGTPLRAGEFVLLGSVVETKWVEAGDVVEIEVDGLGTARARFV